MVQRESGIPMDQSENPIPAEWTILEAAEYAHVPPWELFDQPVYWQNWILRRKDIQAEVERRVQNIRQSRQDRKSKKAGRRK